MEFPCLRYTKPHTSTHALNLNAYFNRNICLFRSQYMRIPIAINAYSNRNINDGNNQPWMDNETKLLTYYETISIQTIQ